MSKFGQHADKGHLWPYHCEKHNCGHGGACASCLKEAGEERDRASRQRLLDENAKLSARIAELLAAIDALPVEEWVEQDNNGDPELIGYIMQAQGEWDRVKRAAAALREGDD